MIKTLIYTTENNNSYIYDHKSRLSMLIHPDLKKAHENPAEVKKTKENLQRFMTQK